MRAARPSSRVPSLVAAAFACGVALTACAPTTYDAALGTTLPPSTTTTLPVGTAAELLPVMVDEVAGLSTRVESGAGDDETAARIAQLWDAIRDEVTAAHPELVEDFEFVVSRCQLAVERHRPADADRAYRNVVVLAEAVIDN